MTAGVLDHPAGQQNIRREICRGSKTLKYEEKANQVGRWVRSGRLVFQNYQSTVYRSTAFVVHCTRVAEPGHLSCTK